MSRARHVTHARTAERIKRIRNLISALQTKPLTRDEIGAVICLGQSGVSKYLAELRGKYELGLSAGAQVCRLTISEEEARAYIAGLVAKSLARPTRATASKLAVAAKDPARHFHILEDDEHFTIRINRAPAARDPLVAAFFGAAAVRMEARA